MINSKTILHAMQNISQDKDLLVVLDKTSNSLGGKIIKTKGGDRTICYFDSLDSLIFTSEVLTNNKMKETICLFSFLYPEKKVIFHTFGCDDFSNFIGINENSEEDIFILNDGIAYMNDWVKGIFSKSHSA